MDNENDTTLATKKIHSHTSSVDSSFTELFDTNRTARSSSRVNKTDTIANVDMIVFSQNGKELINTFLAEDLTSNLGRIRFVHDSYEPVDVLKRLVSSVRMKKIRYVSGTTVTANISVADDGTRLFVRTSRR
jgi:hypothetical protein